jgi:hypothetical protein
MTSLTPESKATAESKPKRFAGLLIYVHDSSSTLFVTISFKQIDHFHNLDKFKYSFIYRVSKKKLTPLLFKLAAKVSVFFTHPV